MRIILECEEAYCQAIDNLNALEQAIVDICLPDIVREIQKRKRMIQKK